jgi:hypothetical protein
MIPWIRGSGGGEFTDGWFRKPIYEYSKVNPWFSLETRNRHLSVTLRHGHRDKWCNCNDIFGCPDDTQTVSSEWDVVTDDNGKYLFSRFYPKVEKIYPDRMNSIKNNEIVCMRFGMQGGSTCDISKHLDEGYKFIHPTTGLHGSSYGGGANLDREDNFFHSDVISLPARINWGRDITFENANVAKSTSLLEGDTIDSCDEGSRTVVDSDVNIVMCLKRDAIQCASFMGNDLSPTVSQRQASIITDCSNHRIYTTCAGLEDTTEFNNCFAREVVKCQELKLVDTRGVSFLTLGFHCSYAHEYCTGNQYFDLRNGECRTCESLYGGKQYELIKNSGVAVEMRCTGAYAGRTECKDTDPGKTLAILDPDNELDYFEELETTYSTCQECYREKRADEYVDEAISCKSVWKRGNDNVIGYALETTYNILITCVQGACEAGYYELCAATTSCLQCSCGSSCGEGIGAFTDVCVMDNNNICDGSHFENIGYNCTNRAEVASECPIGTSYDANSWQKKNADGNFPLQFVNYITDLIADMCFRCVHPAYQDIPVDDRGGIGEDEVRCPVGLYWPNCTEKGMQYPECTACSESPANSSWVSMNKNPKPTECDWECNENYYETNGKCARCDDGTCPVGFFRPHCSSGTSSQQGCEICPLFLNEDAKNECPDKYFIKICDGTGYCDRDDFQTDKLQCTSSCVECKKEANCTTNTDKWEICRTGSISDTGRCVNCAGGPTELDDNSDAFHAVENQGECDFVCSTGHYNNGQTCVACNTDVSDVCNCGDDCDGYTVFNCSSIGLYDPPTCLCNQGYAESNGDPDDNQVECEPCHSYMVAHPYPNPTCYYCPSGYSGATEFASFECIPCPVNTYRSRTMYGGCEQCDAGTDGLIGSNTCEEDCGTGMRAKLVPWDGYVRNYNTIGEDKNWTHWHGQPPIKCVVEGMSQDIQLCKTPGAYETIQWTSFGKPGDTSRGIRSISPTWACDTCSNGLAYSTNFDWTGAF